MDTKKINNWLSLIANFAVVIGIFALVAEINHASKLSEVAAYQSRMRDIQELNLQEALSETLSDILVKLDNEGIESLTPAEFRRARAWYSTILRGMQGQYYQYQQGFLDRESIDQTLDDIVGLFYQKWVEFNLLGKIEIKEWRAEIKNRMIGADKR